MHQWRSTRLSCLKGTQAMQAHAITCEALDLLPDWVSIFLIEASLENSVMHGRRARQWVPVVPECCACHVCEILTAMSSHDTLY